MYGLFEKQDNGRWLRLYPEICAKKSAAVRIFQNSLLANPLKRALRPTRGR